MALFPISPRMSAIGVWRQNGIRPFSLAPRHNYTLSNYLVGNIIDSFYLLTVIKSSCAHLAVTTHTESWRNYQNHATNKDRCIYEPFSLLNWDVLLKYESDLSPLTSVPAWILSGFVTCCHVMAIRIHNNVCQVFVFPIPRAEHIWQ